MSRRRVRAPEGTLAIALVVDQFPELSETFISGEAQELRRAGHRVHVEAGMRAPHPDAAAAAGLDTAWMADDSRAARLASLAWLVARHPLRCLRDLTSRARWAREETPRPLRQLAPAARRVARFGARHLHAHFAAGAALDAVRLGALLDVPYSVATHGYDIFQTPRNLVEKHERAAFAVTACEYSAAHLRRVLPPETALGVHRLVVGVDAARFARTTPHPHGRSVIAIARLVEKKGLRYLVEAAAVLRERGRPLDEVVIVGDGPLRGDLERQASERGVSTTVRFVGARPPDEARDLLEHADVLVMPCVVAADGDRDTMPVVVKEALAMEVLVAASDEVGLPEVVRPEWGRLCPPGDATALADALDDLLTLGPDERRRMGKRGRAFVRAECSLSLETAKLAALIRAARRD